MTRLSKALQLWLKEGHTQRQFSVTTGIDAGTTHRLFHGRRGLSPQQRGIVAAVFKDRGKQWIAADLLDQLPAQLAEEFTVLSRNPAFESDNLPRTRIDRAKAEFIRALEDNDPGVLELVLALYDWRHGPEK